MTGEGSQSGINRASAITAGVVATVVITITMAIDGMNVLANLGGMMGMSGAGGYIVGGIVHLIIGLIYAFIFAALLGSAEGISNVINGVGFGLAITAIALALMPIMASAGGGGGGANPCNPCNPCNACNPCAGGSAYGNLMSAVHHVIYGLTLAFMYKSE